MKIAIASDLHLEFFSHDAGVFNEFLCKFRNDEEEAETLILAGDITTSRTLTKFSNEYSGKHSEFKKFDSLMSYCSAQYKHVIVVLGNHEHWHGVFQNTEKLFKEYFSKFDNVHLLEKQSIILDSFSFYGATFWTDFNRDPFLKLDAPNKMNDYRSVVSNRNGSYHKLLTDDVLIDHIEAVKLLKNNTKVDVVVSHHAPSELSVHDCYKGNITNGLYYTNMDKIILDKSPKLWVHGHMHMPNNYFIGETRVVSNPCGYHGSEVDVRDFNLVYFIL